MLTRWGHEVTLAANWAEALKQVAQRQFDLMLMDVQMLEMDGFTATRLIRESEKDTGQRLPIIAAMEEVLGAGRDPGASCRHAGAGHQPGAHESAPGRRLPTGH